MDTLFVLLAPQLQRVNDANQWGSQQHRQRENAVNLKVEWRMEESTGI